MPYCLPHEVAAIWAELLGEVGGSLTGCDLPTQPQVDLLKLLKLRKNLKCWREGGREGRGGGMSGEGQEMSEGWSGRDEEREE